MPHTVTLSFVFFLSCLYGCAAYYDKPKKVILQHPQTMEFVDCRVDRWETVKSFEKNEECVENYKRQGYIVWGEF